MKTERRGFLKTLLAGGASAALAPLGRAAPSMQAKTIAETKVVTLREPASDDIDGGEMARRLSQSQRRRDQRSRNQRTLKALGTEILPDGRCGCDCATACPLKKIGMSDRCTKEELEASGVKTWAYQDESLG